MRRTILALLAALGLVVAAAQPANAVTYGWKWGEVVDVYDGTTGGNWKISQAIREWDKTSGIVIRRVYDPAAANIIVSEVPALGWAGLAYVNELTITNGVASGLCRVELNADHRNLGVAEETALHEMGHCLGLAHTDVRQSVMTAYGSRTDYFTRPTSYDRADMQAIYGR